MSPAQKEVSWIDMLESAATLQDVHTVVRSYLDSWPAADLEALPRQCKPPVHFIQAEDVVAYAYELVTHHCGEGAGDEKVAQLATFFGNAARRIAVLMGDRSRPKPVNDYEF